jgi:hypothetical protein
MNQQAFKAILSLFNVLAKFLTRAIHSLTTVYGGFFPSGKINSYINNKLTPFSFILFE